MQVIGSVRINTNEIVQTSKMRVGGSPKPVLNHRVHAPSSRKVIYLTSRCEKDIDIQNTKLRGMSCTCEPMEAMYVLQSPLALSSKGFLDPNR